MSCIIGARTIDQQYSIFVILVIRFSVEFYKKLIWPCREGLRLSRFMSMVSVTETLSNTADSISCAPLDNQYLAGKLVGEYQLEEIIGHGTFSTYTHNIIPCLTLVVFGGHQARVLAARWRSRWSLENRQSPLPITISRRKC